MLHFARSWDCKTRQIVSRITINRTYREFRFGGGGGSRTFPQPLEPATYTFYKEYEVPKVPLCRGYRTPIVHGGLFERPPLMSKPEPNCKAKGEVVEAGRIELPSEETDDRERSCFSQVHLCLVSVA